MLLNQIEALSVIFRGEVGYEELRLHLPIWNHTPMPETGAW
jgi:hypothetical protein